MKALTLVLILIAGMPLAPAGEAGPAPNTLTESEKKEGWLLLFNGVDLGGWKIASKDTAEGSAWTVIDGTLVCPWKKERRKESLGGSLATNLQFENFDLRLDYRLEGTGAVNSGIKYFNYPGTELGLEYQLFSPREHGGRPGNNTGDLYDLLKADPVQPAKDGEWNSVRIVARGKMVEHWLNDVKILSFERGSEVFRAAVAKSKFKNTRKPFGEGRQGHILLQDHGGGATFRNVKLRPLPAARPGAKS